MRNSAVLAKYAQPRQSSLRLKVKFADLGYGRTKGKRRDDDDEMMMR
jgi:hypothetical protein